MPDTPTSLAAELRALADRVDALDAGPPPPPPWQARFPGDTRPGTLRWGASITGNGDPVARHEAAAGHPLGIRRTFWQAGQVDKMAATARADLAAKRLPWVSIKPPASWAAVAAGSHDAWIAGVWGALAGIGPVWLTLHHEPENDGPPAADWRAMQARFRARRPTNATNVAFASILMAWTFDPRSGRNPADWWVADTFDLAGVDYYVESQGPAIADGSQWTAARRFYGDRGMVMAVGEWANRGTDRAAADRMTAWFDHLAGSASDGKGARVVGASNFDSSLNGGWQLAGEPLARFRSLLRDPRAVLVGE